MAQLPPKIPPITQNWPHQKTFNSTTAGGVSSHPSWVDEFLDFSSARRGAHRRSASDSIAFFEVDEEEEETHHHNTTMINLGAAFDRLNDEQLLSMFSDEVSTVVPPATFSSSSPISSTPSDQNSNNENKPMSLDQQQHQQPKPEPGEVESSCDIESQQAPAVNTADPKRVKRVLANRQSAQRSRVRKLQYISELERSVTTLQCEVSALSPRVAFLDHQRLILNFDNSALKQRIAALAQDKIFKDAHQEALKKEIERLRQVYYQQSLTNNDNNNASSPNSDNIGCTDKDHQTLITSQLR